MLGQLRDERGRPNLRARVLGIVVALLLAGPLTLLVVQVVGGVIDALY